MAAIAQPYRKLPSPQDTPPIGRSHIPVNQRMSQDPGRAEQLLSPTNMVYCMKATNDKFAVTATFAVHGEINLK